MLVLAVVRGILVASASAVPADRSLAASSSNTTPRSRKNEPGTHKGGGETIGYSFFAKAQGLKMVFRKRALKPGSGIGYHEQKEDEIYYVLSGRGVMTVDGKSFDVTPGTAVLTRPGSSHGLKQAGDRGPGDPDQLRAAARSSASALMRYTADRHCRRAS